ncbi:MAG: rod shape-determining protein MreD [Candidatus Porifericomitaceae bacterium WSBS_2022_MAG_OTU9]
MLPYRIGMRGFIFASICAAMLLSAIPMPEEVAAYQPMWPVMVLVYWALTLPDKTSYILALALGLCMDVQQGVLLGQNMISFSAVLYLSVCMHKTMRLASLPMQAIAAGFIFVTYLFGNWLISVATGLPPVHAYYWLPALSSAVLWPWVSLLLRDLRRRAVAS